jgi:hypothetical protein
LIYATKQAIFSGMDIPENLTIKVPYTVVETGATVFVERNARIALQEAQDKVRTCEMIVRQLETEE